MDETNSSLRYGNVCDGTTHKSASTLESTRATGSSVSFTKRIAVATRDVAYFVSASLPNVASDGANRSTSALKWESGIMSSAANSLASRSAAFCCQSSMSSLLHMYRGSLCQGKQ